MRSRCFFAVWLLSMAIGDVAYASGPVERLVEVLLAADDPSLVVVRWGAASEGYLYSRDGGKTFAALCSAAIEPSIKRLSAQHVYSNAATLIDDAGRVLVGQLDGLWSDDGTGCSWHKELAGYWPTALARDPHTGEVLAVVNQRDETTYESRARFLRRAADGTWTPFEQGGELIAHIPMQQALGAELMISGTRFYASLQVASGSSVEQQLSIVHSDDGGKTWLAAPPLPDAQNQNFSLIAADPKQPARLLAVLYRDNAADTLLISEDAGASFDVYAEVREVRSVTFAPDGRVYISDAGDSSTAAGASGGLWTAAQLGQPLSKVDNTTAMDCAVWLRDALYVCQGNKVRAFDPARATFGADVVEIGKVASLLSCPGKDVSALCQDQLNMGASWCCTGHYPCSAFCSAYDVTESHGERVFCGRAGIAQDVTSGRTCEPPADAGVVDAGVVDAGVVDAGKGAPKKGDDGCTIGEHRPRRNRVGGALTSLGLLLIMLGRTLRNRRRAQRRRG